MDVTLQDPLVGRVVDDRYLVRSRIARGGMATVYRALDRRLDREVALKVMHDNLAVDEEFVSRFVREARAAARLSHPNVVQVFDQGSDLSVLYLAMEYLPGRTLRDVLAQRGALTARESVSVLEPVLGALAAAHRAGIVHRDVKPENVILTDDGRIKVADFGLAGAVVPATHAATAAGGTAAGDLLGTVAYLAPELVTHGSGDARADVYAAGVMLFEMLTGRQPFTGADPVRVAHRHVDETVPAPSAVAPGLPDAFDEVVAAATAHDPGRRPAGADELLARVRRVAAAMPDEELDRRAADAATLRVPAPAAPSRSVRPRVVRTVAPDATRAFGPEAALRALADEEAAGPAPADGPQPTRALAVGRRSARARAQHPDQGPDGTPGRSERTGRPPVVPRLRVHDDEPPPPGFLGDRTRQAVAVVVGIVLVMVAVFTGVWWFTGGPGSFTSTPAVVGEPVTDARRILQVNGLVPVEKKVFSDTVAAGQVVSSDPPGGERVKKDGGRVVLNVSAGPELVTVPDDLVGASEDDARASIEDARLKVGEVKRRFSATVDRGDVISTAPRAGSRVAPGREVGLLVSKGVEPVRLDSVVGQDVEAARRQLEAKGLKVETREQDFQNGSPAPGTVVGQDPAVTDDDQTVPKGSTVTLTVVTLPEGLAVVPDLRGQDFEQARQTLEGLGLRVRREGLPFTNTVRGQNAQGPVPVGTEVVLWVGP